jgi:hypothetical protein
MLAPGDDVSAGNGAQFRWGAQSGEARKFLDISFVSTAGLEIGNVGQPFELRRHVSQAAVLSRSKNR